MFLKLLLESTFFFLLLILDFDIFIVFNVCVYSNVNSVDLDETSFIKALLTSPGWKRELLLYRRRMSMWGEKDDYFKNPWGPRYRGHKFVSSSEMFNSILAGIQYSKC